MRKSTNKYDPNYEVVFTLSPFLNSMSVLQFSKLENYDLMQFRNLRSSETSGGRQPTGDRRQPTSGGRRTTGNGRRPIGNGSRPRNGGR